MNNSSLECKIVPVREALDSLSDSIQRAHTLFTDLHSRISWAMSNAPIQQIGESENKASSPACSDLTAQIKDARNLVEGLCTRIIADLDSIEL